MRASNISLSFAAALASSGAGAFVSGFAAGLTRNANLSLLLFLPAAMVAANLSGRWIARRDNPPTSWELGVGCLMYMILSGLAGASLQHDVGLIQFVVSLVVAWLIYRTARRPLAVTTNRSVG